MAALASKRHLIPHVQPPVESKAAPTHLRIIDTPAAPAREALSLVTYAKIGLCILVGGIFGTLAIEGLTTNSVYQSSHYAQQIKVLRHEIAALETSINKRLSLTEIDKEAVERGMIIPDSPGFVQASSEQFEMATEPAAKLDLPR